MCSSSVPTTDRTQHDDIPSAAATARVEAADLSRARNNQDFTHKYYEPSHALQTLVVAARRHSEEEGEKIRFESGPLRAEHTTAPRESAKCLSMTIYSATTTRHQHQHGAAASRS